ncbi:gliding motility associated protein GldN [Parabacteroides sp. PF5-5]|uniref:type IX secretion system ring protein PorN/GldN n=1 Tax=unclassified Parabacteroides TaxID=2649774 RepID=UPI0024737BA7|nr:MULTISPECIES: gliding motility protein GldN [unclassified Parabacteroides]MDH6304987.1 gliding motility associated protein GldN [Parabacteroides sp. PH5-39]MDH6315928.1 gliding motility associated protein GldN [Parabacteroides sp. PF5-13]MDH6319585.1 gliding motility associated protein GldN [Parabacteroides sp. PH5-13]MDH6323316.1 gliding motility associated protein GldN [Parabacteroides sp. PH5-8]MDH6327176.1 gliding motility associated protein GldN [Parabacteroides sp. PH5-41]
MKRLYYILALTSILIAPLSLYAQEEGNDNQERRSPRARTGGRESDKKESGLPELTIRAQDMNERMTQEIGNARWMRVIYRQVDLNKEQNAPLYYPVRPLNGSMNLFSTIFQLMSENKLEAYRYEDGFEAFDEEHLINFKEDVLDRAYIYYEEIPGQAGGAPSYIINESDIPSGDVMAYYVKEAWYFDQNNSVFDVKTLAICPILTVSGDLGEQTTPLFWIPYENIRPYITNSRIMTSNINNAKTFTIDDYFRRRMFEGEIIKTENLMNRTLRQMYPEPDSLMLAQKEIEKQLETFQQSLYWQPDTTQVANTKESKKAAKSSRVTKTASTKTTKATKQPKVSTPKAENSAPVRSVRKRR